MKLSYFSAFISAYLMKNVYIDLKIPKHEMGLLIIALDLSNSNLNL